MDAGDCAEARRLSHELLEPQIHSCIEKFRKLSRLAPRKTPLTSMETFLLEWASYKRRVAEIAAECIMSLIPQVREVYYTDLSEDYAGRDIDLVIITDYNGIHERELEDTIEAILTKLAEAAGFKIRGLTGGASTLFEVHRRDTLIGSRARLTPLTKRG